MFLIGKLISNFSLLTEVLLMCINRREELATALKTCQEETRKAFGDDHIFLERYLEKPRHIEVQILADSFGRVIHLGERECSVQRRYQKVIEETPSPALSESQRKGIGELACTLAREAGYVNAGTVEFMLDQQGDFYFLEMNTRLQVEHPVTEWVTGLDLVELQLRIAAGQPLPFQQNEVEFKGWAMEARICAEDPFQGVPPGHGDDHPFSGSQGEKHPLGQRDRGRQSDQCLL